MRIGNQTAPVRRTRRSSCTALSFGPSTAVLAHEGHDQDKPPLLHEPAASVAGVAVRLPLRSHDIDRERGGTARLVPLIHLATDAQAAGSTRPSSSNG
jgi:hypothetical protein